MHVIDLPNTSPYQPVWELQRRLQRELIDGNGEEAVILCEHEPTITVGKSGKRENILVKSTRLSELGVALFEVERGGDVTYHGPGQLVCYPILNLNWRRRDVGWYMRTLEQVVLDTLQALGITALRVPGRTGVWTQPSQNVSDSCGLQAHPGKLASIGVRLSRWCTLHGLALNIDKRVEMEWFKGDRLSGFELINPCGFPEVKAAWINELVGNQGVVQTSQGLFEHTKKIFLENFFKHLVHPYAEGRATPPATRRSRDSL